MRNQLALLAILLCQQQSHGQKKGELDFLARFSARVEKSEATGGLISIRIESDKFSDEDLRHLAKWKELEEIYLKGTKISDDGLKSLNGLSKLRFLILRDNPNLTGIGFAQLNRIDDLESLILFGCPISDEGLKKISEFGTLRNFNLTRTKITDNGMSAVAKLNKLENLRLSHTKITNAGIRQLKDAASIKVLTLAETSIDDKAIEAIAGWQKLEWLDISGTNVSDRSIGQIAKFNKLRVIDIRRTKITEVGFAALKNRFPEASIEFDPAAIR